MDNNQYIERSRFKNAAALVDAVARYDAATDPDVQVNQGRSVVSALARVAPEDFFGLNAYLFVGEACDRMGLADQMARIYSSAIERQLPPELERRIRVQLSDYWTSIGDSTNALKILASLRDSDNIDLAVEARLKMATLHLSREEYDQCKELCLWLVANTKDDATRREALRTLGRAYQALKQFDKAANCFEGLVPADDAQLLQQKEKEPVSGVSTS
jgi:tetratricopeptide (TPR) repeat protein